MSVTLDPLLVLLALTAITFPSFFHCTLDAGSEALYRQINVNFSPLAINCSWSPSIVTSGSSEIQIKLLGQSDIFSKLLFFWENKRPRRRLRWYEINDSKCLFIIQFTGRAGIKRLGKNQQKPLKSLSTDPKN